ncbi:hypothetical protein [Isachenkonia alkalipeptolytica]|uniref:Cohesin domain-containing protein n=1 Tax=Isachenkonia alkalipeptolytica TaxID=2565777 RepID=A0AA43XL82_9CLOT|nr:hypothetical protein [Isachenkonia alkalipeptolytica]NBG88893.1 hypothetical protein [Isachenkonia alkalipeptolytica]
MIIGFFLSPGPVFAEDVGLQIEAGPNGVVAGEVITIYVGFESDQSIGTIHADIIYDDERLEYQSGGGNVAQFGQGKGVISDSVNSPSDSRGYEFVFLVKDSGPAEFVVEFSEVISYEQGNYLGGPTESLVLSFDEASETDENQEEKSEEEKGEQGVDDEKALNTLQSFQLFSIYQQISKAEMSILHIGEIPLSVYRTEDLPEDVYLVTARAQEGKPKIYFYDQREGTLQRAAEEEIIVEKEVEVQGQGESRREFLLWPITLLIVLATILILAIVLLEQLLGEAKSNKQRRNHHETKEK